MSVVRTPLVLLAALVVSLWLAGPAVAGGDAEGPRTVPAADQVLASPPPTFAVAPPPGATTGTARILDGTGRELAHGELGPVEGGLLGWALPSLDAGVYLVDWSAGGNEGAVAFHVTGGLSSPVTVVQPTVHAKLPAVQDKLVGWVPLVSIMIFGGVLALRFVSTAPVARRLGAGALEGSDRRLVRVAAVAAAVAVPATFAERAYDDGAFDLGRIGPALGDGAAGGVLVARLALTVVAALVLIPAALGRVRPPGWVLGAGLACGAAELVLREVPTKAPPVLTRAVFNTFMWVGHLWGSALWIGGLVGLLALVVRGPVPAGVGHEFWPPAIRRFSTVAVGAVAALVLSGLWLYWVHIDGLGQLVTTIYGRTLLVKLAVFAVLLGVGAANQFWLMPRLDADRAVGDRVGVRATVARHVRSVVAAEVVLLLALLGVASMLSGSSRNQALQASPAAFAQQAKVGDAAVEFTASGMQPGLIDYLVRVEGAAPKQVRLTFAAPGLDVPARGATAVAVGDGTYRVSGYYTPVIGEWEVGVGLDDAPPATFALPIAAEPAPAPRAPAKVVHWTTWAFGAAETALVVAVLVGACRVSRRLTDRRIPAAPVAGPEPGLVGASAEPGR